MKHSIQETVALLVLTLVAGLLGLLAVRVLPRPVESPVDPVMLVVMVMLSVGVGALLWLGMLKFGELYVGPVFSAFVAIPAARLLSFAFGIDSLWGIFGLAAVLAGLLQIAQATMEDAWSSKKKWGEKGVNRAVILATFLFMLAVVWIGADLSLRVSPVVATVLLALLAVYDAWAVWKSKHMVSLAVGFLKRGVIPGFALKKKQWRQFALLGGGDVFFLILVPGSFIASGWFATGLSVFFGMFASLVWLFWVSEKGKFYPALPALLAGAVAGYLGYVAVALAVLP